MQSGGWQAKDAAHFIYMVSSGLLMRASSVNQLIEKGMDCRLSGKLVFPNDTKGRNKSQFAE